MSNLAADKGYTLIELLVVMVIIGIILVFGVTSYQGFNDRQKIKIARQTVLNDLRYARSMATNGRKPSGCTEVLDGYMFAIVSANSNQYSIYPICVNADGTPGSCVGSECDEVTRTVTLDPVMQLMISPNPNQDILFYTLGRGTNVSTPSNIRSVRVRAPSVGAATYNIDVNSVGSISPQ